MRNWLTAALLVMVTVMGLKIWTLQADSVAPAVVAVATPVRASPTAPRATPTLCALNWPCAAATIYADVKTAHAPTSTPVVRYVPYYVPAPPPPIAARPAHVPPSIPAPQISTPVTGPANRGAPSQTLCDESGRCYQNGHRVQCPATFLCP